MATDRPSTESAPKLRGAATEDEAGNVIDPADVTPRAVETKLTGRRLRGIPAVITKSGDRGTMIEIRPVDVATAGGPELKHVLRFDTQRESATLVVGDEDNQVPSDVAEFLAKNYPTSFEYMNE